MRSNIIFIAIDFVAHAHCKEFLVNYAVDVHESFTHLADKLIAALFGQAVKVWPSRPDAKHAITSHMSFVHTRIDPSRAQDRLLVSPLRSLQRLALQSRPQASQSFRRMGPRNANTVETFLGGQERLLARRKKHISIAAMQDEGSCRVARPWEFPTKEDWETINRRQVQRKYDLHVIGVPCKRCKHGFAQAAVLDPFDDDRPYSGREVKLQSGGLRLTCPWLVKAIDELEDQGAITEFNTLLTHSEDEFSKKLRDNLGQVNRYHRLLRKELVNETPQSQRLFAQARKYHGAELTERILETGIIGIPQRNLNDVKCLHAQLADELLRPGENLVGVETIKKLSKRGIDVAGGQDCWQQCDLKFTGHNTSWQKYIGRKNLAKKIVNQERRVAQRRQQEKEKQAATKFSL